MWVRYKVETLWLSGKGITDKSLKNIYKLKKLRIIFITNANITKDGQKEINDYLKIF